jgi:pyrroline-5-carboxylate reductase
MHCRDRAAWRRAVDTTGQGALQQDVSFVKSLFEALGTVYQVDEHQMDGA